MENVNIATTTVVDDETPLIAASRNGDLQTVCDLMYNKNLDVNLPDDIGCTPLYYATTNNHFHVVQELIEQPMWQIHIATTTLRGYKEPL